MAGKLLFNCIQMNNRFHCVISPVCHYTHSNLGYYIVYDSFCKQFQTLSFQFFVGFSVTVLGKKRTGQMYSHPPHCPFHTVYIDVDFGLTLTLGTAALAPRKFVPTTPTMIINAPIK